MKRITRASSKTTSSLPSLTIPPAHRGNKNNPSHAIVKRVPNSKKTDATAVVVANTSAVANTEEKNIVVSAVDNDNNYCDNNNSVVDIEENNIVASATDNDNNYCDNNNFVADTEENNIVASAVGNDKILSDNNNNSVADTDEGNKEDNNILSAAARENEVKTSSKFVSNKCYALVLVNCDLEKTIS